MKLYLLSISSNDSPPTIQPLPQMETITLAGRLYYVIPADSTKSERKPSDSQKQKPNISSTPHYYGRGSKADVKEEAKQKALDLILDAGDNGLPASVLRDELSQYASHGRGGIGWLISALVRSQQIRRIGYGDSTRWAIK